MEHEVPPVEAIRRDLRTDREFIFKRIFSSGHNCRGNDPISSTESGGKIPDEASSPGSYRTEGRDPELWEISPYPLDG